jgi:hypothetical protein
MSNVTLECFALRSYSCLLLAGIISMGRPLITLVVAWHIEQRPECSLARASMSVGDHPPAPLGAQRGPGSAACPTCPVGPVALVCVGLQYGCQQRVACRTSPDVTIPSSVRVFFSSCARASCAGTCTLLPVLSSSGATSLLMVNDSC